MPTIVWKPSFPLEIYDYAREGLSDRKIAMRLGVSEKIFKIGKKKRPSVLRSLKRGRGKIKSSEKYAESMQEYVYRRMSPNVKVLFDQLKRWKDEPNFMDRCDQLFALHGKNVRQTLFVEFFIHCRFNASQACRMVGISKSTLDNWRNTDPIFHQMIEEIEWHKDNLLDSAYWKLVMQGSEKAILMGQQTRNAGKGFQQTKKLTVDGVIEHDHDHSVKIENLPLKLRKRLLKEFDKQQALPEHVPDAELVTPMGES